MSDRLEPTKIFAMGAENYTFTLYSNGSASFEKGVEPMETIILNELQVLDVYDTLTKFLSSTQTMREEDGK